MTEPSARSGSAAEETYPPSAAIAADSGYLSCHSTNEPTKTGRFVATASAEHSPRVTGRRRRASGWRAVFLAVQHLELLSSLAKERDGSRRRARHDFSLWNDHGRDRVQGDGFRQSRTELVESARAGRQRAASRFAQTQRLPYRLQLVERRVSVQVHRFGLRTAALRRLVHRARSRACPA